MKTNLKIVRKKIGLTQEKAAELSGYPLGTLRRWEQGVNEPDMEAVIKLASLYGVSTDTILGSKFADDLDGIEKYGSFASFSEVPIYGSIAAGIPIEMIEIDDVHPIPTPIHDKYPEAYLLRIKGESMNRVLPNGCYALIDPREEIDCDNKPYAVCVNGFDATVKRVKKLENGFQLVPDSDDPTFPVQTFNYNEPGTDEITVIGKVVWHVIPFEWSY